MKTLASIPLLILCLLFLPESSSGRDPEEIKKSGVIRIGFTETDYATINYPLAVEFAKYLNVELEEVTITWDQAFQTGGAIPEDVRTNPDVVYTPDVFSQVDAIFSTFTILEWRKKLFDFAQTLYSAELIMIHSDEESPKTFDDLRDRSIALMRGTSFEAGMARINESIEGDATIVLTEISDEAKDLLKREEVWGIILDADEALNFAAKQDNMYKIGMPISSVSKTAYAVEKGNGLKLEIEEFFETIAVSGALDKIFDDMFGLTYSDYYQQISKSSKLDQKVRDLDEILASRKITVALRERNFIYKKGGPKQFMHALAEEFADYLGVELEFVVTPYFAKYWETSDGRVVKDSIYTPDWFNYYDVACEVIAPLDWRTNKVELVGIYPTEYTVIARKETNINSIEDLKDLKGVTASGTVYEEILQNNGITDFYMAPVNNFIPDVSEGKADYTMIYNAFFELSDYPGLEVKIPMGEFHVSWAMRKDQPELKRALDNFLNRSRDKGLINILVRAMRGQTLQTAEDFISSYYESFQTGQLPYVLYGAEDGLPQEDVFSIFQDEKGYMWFGTNSGVVRYNGREMTVFNAYDGLLDNTVKDIKQDTSGIIYFATSKGVSVFRDDTIIRTLLPEVSFRSIYTDHTGSVWLLGDDGLYRAGENFSTSHINEVHPELPARVYGMAEDPVSGDKFIASAEGVFLYSENDGEVREVFSGNCYSVFIDVNDSIWISTREGLLIAGLKDLGEMGTGAPLRSLNGSLGLSNVIIKGIFQNAYGSVWLISDSEILQVLSTDQQAIKYEKEIGLRINNILSFWVDREDNIWIGFSGGLQRLTNKRGLRNFYPNTISSYIYSAFQDRAGRIWIASHNGIYYYREQLVNYTPRLPDGTTKYCAAVLPSGNILTASSGGIYEIDLRTLQLVRRNRFENILLGIENIFVSDDEGIFLLTGLNGIVYHLEDFNSEPVSIQNKQSTSIYQLIEYEGDILGGNKNDVMVFENGDFNALFDINCNIWSLCELDDILWIGTDCGLWRYALEEAEHIVADFPGSNTVVKSILPARNRNYLWLGTNNGFSYYNISSSLIEFTIDSKDGLPGNEITVGSMFTDDNDLLWIGTYHGLSNFNIRAKASRSFAPLCYIENIDLNGDPISKESGRTFRYFENNFVFEISGLSFSDEASIEYEFYLRGLEHDYSSYNRGPEYKAYFSNLPAGNYEFIYKAKGKNNIWGYAQKYEFTIKKAWYHTWVFRITLVLLIISGAWLFYKIRVRSIEAQKKHLESLVRERTRELEEANIEIEAQRDLATVQRDQISQQKVEIEDSIHYAKRIQRSLLPSREVLKNILPEHFIMFKPRDIVSGDFYWANTVKDHFIITAADCTGHGVPGAFMSMLGIAYLNDIVNKQEKIDAADILNNLRREIIQALGQKGEEGEAKDGMDMALCIIDPDHRSLQFAGAYNSLYLVRKGELEETKGDKMPVAIYEYMASFKAHRIKLEPGDALYMFSDGYADQFGGEKGKKFMSKTFKKLLIEHSGKSMPDQLEILEKTMVDWMDGVDQIDDMVVIGMRI